MKGTYCLIIHNQKPINIKVGAILNQVYFQKGYYVYIGSAMNSLIPRINRHLSDEKKIHWHIDYLLKEKNIIIQEIIFNIGNKKIECDLARFISKKGKEVAKFGCSDCDCNSHLIYFDNLEKSLKIVKDGYDNLNVDHYDLNYFKTLI